MVFAREPSDDSDSEEEEEGDELESAGAKVKPKKGVKVDIDLGLSAYANATRYVLVWSRIADQWGVPLSSLAGIMDTRNRLQRKSSGR